MFPSLLHIKLVPHLTVILKTKSSFFIHWFIVITDFCLHHGLLIHGEYSHNENETARKFYMKFLIPF